jgi:hypothetical protein
MLIVGLKNASFLEPLRNKIQKRIEDALLGITALFTMQLTTETFLFSFTVRMHGTEVVAMMGHIPPTNRIAGSIKMEAATTTAPVCPPRGQEVVSYRRNKMCPSVVGRCKYCSNGLPAESWGRETHTDTQTHTHTHRQTHRHRHRHTHRHTQTDTHRYRHTHTHTETHRHTHRHTHTQTYTQTYTQTHTHRHRHTHTHTHTDTHRPRHTPTQTHTVTQTHTDTLTHERK